jgi:hypothetical protein
MLLSVLCDLEPNADKQFASIWKYNFAYHIQHEHPTNWDDDTQTAVNLPAELANQLLITHEELVFLKIRPKGSSDPTPFHLQPQIAGEASSSLAPPAAKATQPKRAAPRTAKNKGKQKAP